jgi:hypothetical protein
MFVMTSPLEAHLSETLTSLKFATKVYYYLVLYRVDTNFFRSIIPISAQRRSQKERTNEEKDDYCIHTYHFKALKASSSEPHIAGSEMRR